jgi:hypothetical protein
MGISQIEEQALLLAKENKDAEPDIAAVYWFPNEQEVRLIEIMPSIVSSTNGRVTPFYFRADPGSGLPAPSGIALIRPEEFRKLKLPDDWGDWDEAKLIVEESK